MQVRFVVVLKLGLAIDRVNSKEHEVKEAGCTKQVVRSRL